MTENSPPTYTSNTAGISGQLSVAGIAPLTQFGLIQCTGEDAQSFLQGQLSCDVNAVRPDSAIYGSYNTPKGRMLATFLLWRDETGYMLQLPRSMCESTRKRLALYVLRSKVKLLDVSDEYALLGIAGVGATSQLERLFDTLPPAALSISIGTDARLLRLDSERFQVAASRSRCSEIQKILSNHLPLLSTNDWDWTNIQSGIPFITPQTQDQFVPQMANLDLINGVSFSKGCYPGQEIVARMHYLGKLKQRMYLATLHGEDMPQSGDKLFSLESGEQATGMIVNTASAPDGDIAVLAVMHIASFKGGDVRLKSPAGPRLNFRNLPYEIPS